MNFARIALKNYVTVRYKLQKEKKVTVILGCHLSVYPSVNHIFSLHDNSRTIRVRVLILTLDLMNGRGLV